MKIQHPEDDLESVKDIEINEDNPRCDRNLQHPNDVSDDDDCSPVKTVKDYGPTGTLNTITQCSPQTSKTSNHNEPVIIPLILFAVLLIAFSCRTALLIYMQFSKTFMISSTSVLKTFITVNALFRISAAVIDIKKGIFIYDDQQGRACFKHICKFKLQLWTKKIGTCQLWMKFKAIFRLLWILLTPSYHIASLITETTAFKLIIDSRGVAINSNLLQNISHVNQTLSAGMYILIAAYVIFRGAQVVWIYRSKCRNRRRCLKSAIFMFFICCTIGFCFMIVTVAVARSDYSLHFNLPSFGRKIFEDIKFYITLIDAASVILLFALISILNVFTYAAPKRKTTSRPALSLQEQESKWKIKLV